MQEHRHKRQDDDGEMKIGKSKKKKVKEVVINGKKYKSIN
jgi:hypothetical protein|tara:strand:- start:45 stop:164 length:120 start_codon:yes stop_codon:yes gene_type:complete